MGEDTLAKPAPPRKLLPKGHEWRVVEAPHWTVESYGRCTFNVGLDKYQGCGGWAVAVEREPKKARYDRFTTGLTSRCAEHLGSIRWIRDGVVYQWRATWTN